MNALLDSLKALHEDESAVTTLEYVIIVTLVAFGAIGMVALLQGELEGLYGDVHEEMSSGQVRGGMSVADPVNQ